MSNDSTGFMAALRDALGAEPGERIQIVTPQFEREDDITVDWRPESRADIDRLRSASEETLIELGLRRWEDNLWLFPYEWRDDIPIETEVETINGRIVDYDPDEFRDKRFGVLACGIRREGSDD